MNDTVKTVLCYLSIILIIIIVRMFIITPVIVNGDSMNDTLSNNDVMILNIIGYRSKETKRFDIIVFKYGNENIIKRVIGLPGEIIEYKDGLLYVNGKIIKEPFIKQKTANFTTKTLIKSGVVPKNTYFVLGDNRNNSYDSRYIGFIKEEIVMGKTNFVLFPFNHTKIIK